MSHKLLICDTIVITVLAMRRPGVSVPGSPGTTISGRRASWWGSGTRNIYPGTVRTQERTFLIYVGDFPGQLMNNYTGRSVVDVRQSWGFGRLERVLLAGGCTPMSMLACSSRALQLDHLFHELKVLGSDAGTGHVNAWPKVVAAYNPTGALR